MNHFVHLHLHSEFSLRDGLVRFKPLFAECLKKNFPAVALTDQCNLFGAIKFYHQAIKAGIKPLIGTEIWLSNPKSSNQPYKSVLLCQNQKGYRNLTRLISKAYLQGQQTGLPLVEKHWLETLNEGLIVLSGGCHGDVGQLLIAGKKEQALQCLEAWAKEFPSRFYIELVRTGRPHEEEYIQAILPLAKQKGIPVVASNDVRFLLSEDFLAHEARVCIHDGYVLEDPNRPRLYSSEQYLRSAEDMAELFQDIPSALSNSVEIMKRCNLELQLGQVFLPAFPTPGNISMEEHLLQSAQKGLAERFQQNSLVNEEIYKNRLQNEIDVINAMGFPGYFLIVADFIAWAKKNDIPVGPGRGSGAGSLVAYALSITDVDPLKYDLLFERFLNPERVSLPDFDIDFCMEGRDRVIDYVAQKYGRQSVSQIITFGTMAAKAVVRDVGRVQGYPYGFVDKIAKLIPFEVGMTLAKALEQEEGLQKRYKQEEEVGELIHLALKLEGVARNAGKHAGGVVISPSDLTDFSPLYCEPDSEHVVTQFDKDDVEAVGLVKFDFLGLRTLTIIDWALKNIHAKGQANLDINKIPMDDEASFALLKRCQTTSIFQLESRGMKDLIKRLQPDCFEDIIALVALYRPGPLQSGMVDDFINRKQGRAPIEYSHPALEPILRPTYGVILYQEQVMQIAQMLAGYTLGGADMLRRAMGKKKPEEMAKQRNIFLIGAEKNGIDAKTATFIFDLMEKFAGYGFNKSHSAAYALLSYQTAWLKAHYPAAFMAAVLSSEMDNTDKILILIEECRSLNLNVLPPDLNQSHYKFTVLDEQRILYGLGAIKGVGEAALESMLTHRDAKGPYRDLFDLCMRVDLRKVNRRVLEALVGAGALDSFDVNRASQYGAIDNALRFAEQQAQNQLSGQYDLFGVTADAKEAPDIPWIEEWGEHVRLEHEKNTLGFYFSSHPIRIYQEELKQFITSPLAELPLEQDKTVILAGMITSLKTVFTKRGDRMAFLSLNDGTGNIEFAVFGDLFELKREILHKDAIIIVNALMNYDATHKTFKLSAKSIMSMEEARATYAKYIAIKLNTQEQTNPIVEFSHLLKPYQYGNCPICILYQSQEAKATIHVGQNWWVFPKDELIQALKQKLGDNNVQVIYTHRESVFGKA